MSAMTNLLIKDDSAVEKTLVPVTDTPNPFWRAIATGVPLEAQIRATMYNETLKNGSQKTSLKLEVPTQETLGASGTSAGYVAPPKVAYTNVGFITMFSDKRATSTDRATFTKCCWLFWQVRLRLPQPVL